MFRRADLIQLSLSNRVTGAFHNSRGKKLPPGLIRFRPNKDGIAQWPMEIERAVASISNVAFLFTFGDADHLKVFANVDAAEKWFEENDPEGVAFEYEILE
jgi:hypothetical protein